MSAYEEKTPLDNPFPGALNIMKKELAKSLDSFVYQFEHANHDKFALSRGLRLSEALMMERSKEIGGKLYTSMQKLMQAATDYANGHGKIESIYTFLEEVKRDLR